MLIVMDFVSLTLSFFYTLNTFMTESILLIYFFIVVFFIYIIYIKEKISTLNTGQISSVHYFC